MEPIVSIALCVIFIVPLWRVCSRAGFNGAMSLLALIPFIGILIVGGVLSFAAWPDRKEGD